MAASLEANKIVGAILTAGIIASLSGNLARIIYRPHELEEPVYRVAAAEPAETQGEAPAAGEETPPLATLLAAADPENGAKVAKKCTACHSLEKGGPDKVGPNLWGVVGRPVAGREGFAYSDALKSIGGEWTYERLDAFLADPKGFAPGTKMSFAGIKDAEDRADLIVYLRTLADAPAPLPAAEAAGGEKQASSGAEAAAAAPTSAEAGTTAAGAGQPAAAGATHPAVALVASAAPEEGAKVARVCKACHSFEKGGPNKIGPNLWGVVGRPVASHGDYAYSAALKALGGEWTYDRLAHFLEDPKGFVPGTKMSFAGIKQPEKLAALLAWLRTQADEPAPLP